MAVDPKDREAYEEGVEDSNKGFFDQLFAVEDTFKDMARSGSERTAYEKGLKGEQLDEDKK